MVRQSGAIRRLESKLNRLGADYDPANEEEPPFVCVNGVYEDHYLYITFFSGTMVEFYYFAPNMEQIERYDLELHEDVAFGRHLRHALKWLGY